MLEFKANQEKLTYRFRQRMLRSAAAFLLVFTASLLAARFMPPWVFYVLLAAAVAVLFTELALSMRASAIGDTVAVRLLDEGLSFYSAEASGSAAYGFAAYQDIRISKIKLARTELAAIHLRTSAGQTIKLVDFDDIRDLHGLLAVRIQQALSSKNTDVNGH